MSNLKFFMAMDKVPTTTSQQKTISWRNRKPVIFKKSGVIRAEKLFHEGLYPYRPQKPLTGAIRLKVMWAFGVKDKKKWGLWKTTRPDTDNLNKSLKDVMTACGFWEDDSQVVYEVIQKAYTDSPGIGIEIEELDECCDVLKEWNEWTSGGTEKRISTS